MTASHVTGSRDEGIGEPSWLWDPLQRPLLSRLKLRRRAMLSGSGQKLFVQFLSVFIVLISRGGRLVEWTHEVTMAFCFRAFGTGRLPVARLMELSGEEAGRMRWHASQNELMRGHVQEALNLLCNCQSLKFGCSSPSSWKIANFARPILAKWRHAVRPCSICFFWCEAGPPGYL